MNAPTRFRAVALALGVALLVGCSTDEASSPTAPPTNPVPPPTGVNVSLSATTTVLEVGSTEPSVITVRATRADNGQPVPNLTQATVTTTLGGFGSVGGPTQVQVELVNGQATISFFGGGVIGTASIRAQVISGVGLLSINIREGGAGETLFISSVSPSSGSAQGGETVTIHGSGFEEPVRVTIGTNSASVQSVSSSQIRVTTPPCSFSGTNACFSPGASTPVAVTVIANANEADQAQDTLNNGFVYQAAGGGGTLQPIIFSVTPSAGPNEGGTQVTINGDGFEAPVAVDFGVNAQSFVSAQVLSVTRTRLVVVSPAATGLGQPNLNQLVDIRVTNQSSGRTTTAADAFRYGVSIAITAMSPTQGPPEGGTLVTIFGRGFDEPVAVTFGGRAQQVISVSGSEILARSVALPQISCANQSGPVSVTNIESGDSASSAIVFTYIVPQLQLFSAAPSTGPQAGNTLVTIVGSNIGSGALVDFVISGTAFSGSVQSTSSTTIGVRTPGIPNSSLPVESCDDNGVPPVTDPPTPNPQGERYLAATASIRVTDPATGCVATLSGAFTFTPTDSSCRGD